MVWEKGHLLKNGEYRIEKPLAQGSFGITYQATYVELEQKVVIKTLKPGLVLRQALIFG